MRALLCLAVLCAIALGALPAAAATRGHRTPARHRHHTKLNPQPKGRAARAGSCANDGLTATAGNLAVIRAAVLCLVNQERSSRGLPALGEDGRLDRAAQGWTATMVSSGQFTHGADFAARISATGFDWSFAGENIATGFPTPEAVISGWMGSLGHCRNLFDPGFSAIGIGMVARPAGGDASGPATWTQDFALPMGHTAPSRNTGPQNGCPY